MAATTTLREFVPALPGSWRVDDRATANHEAWHCVAAILFEVEVVDVRIDRPEYAIGGHVWCRPHLEGWRNAATCIAPMALGETPDRTVTDIQLAAAYWDACPHRDLDFGGLVNLVREILLLPSARRG